MKNILIAGLFVLFCVQMLWIVELGDQIRVIAERSVRNSGDIACVDAHVRQIDVDVQSAVNMAAQAHNGTAFIAHGLGCLEAVK